MTGGSDNVAPAAAAFDRIVAPGSNHCVLHDAARLPGVVWQAESARVRCVSLFSGDTGERLQDVAPYIVEFPRRSNFRNWWFSQWGYSVGILVEADQGIDDLRSHFRRLTVVTDAERKKYFFRFYDPRVLRVFLPACTPAELDQFFGPITAFHCESDGGAELLTFSRGPQGLDVKRRPVVSTAAPSPSTPTPPKRNPYRRV